MGNIRYKMIDNTLNYMYGLQREGIKLDLEATRDFAGYLGNPQNNFKSIHVAGTNGKGSITAFIYNILNQNYKTGMYTSPHLYKFNERIIFNGKMIPDEYIIEFMNKNRNYIETLGKIYRNPTFFETTTVMAFKYFSDMNADFAAIEVGLGGRLDSTNIINPEVSVIGQIGYEHYQRLGCSLTSIAHEKGGIIKPGKPVVLQDDKPEVEKEIKKLSDIKNSKLIMIKDYCEINELKYNIDATSFKLSTPVDTYNIKSSNIGLFQVKNIATAVAAVEQIGYTGRAEIEKGISRTRWPSRFEVMSKDPLVIMDSSHNPPAAMALVQSFLKIVNKKPLLLIGMLDDKDYFSYLTIISKLSDTVIFTTPDEPERAIPPEILAERSKSIFKNIKVVKDPIKAYETAIAESDCVLITGSMYLVGLLRKYLNSSIDMFNSY